MSEAALAIMARSPVLHRSKTRLASALGAHGALQAHCELVEATLDRMRHVDDARVSLWVTGRDATTTYWSTQYDLPLYIQEGRDLGAKMHHALSTLLRDGAGFAVLIGTDCPDIDARYVRQAFMQLRLKPVVLGPAEDGGYGLVGIREPCVDLFQDIQWGTGQVFAQTLRQADRLGLEVAELPAVWDIDTPADWLRYQRWKSEPG